MKPEQEPKYEAAGEFYEEHAAGQGQTHRIVGQLVNRATGIAIPADEPVFVLRARDIHAVALLGAYADLIANGQPEHRVLVAKRIEDFWAFRNKHPERMKEPDSPA